MEKVCYIYEVYCNTLLGTRSVGFYLSLDAAEAAKAQIDGHSSEADKAFIAKHVLNA